MLSILDLFTVDHPVWSVPEVVDTLETSRATGYRYVKMLTSAGLLSAVGNGYYVLGPRIIELDLQIRQSDPLLRSSDGILEKLAHDTGHSALLCTLFQNTVLCVKECRVDSSPTVLIDRGQRRPLLRGAMSKVILAHLASHQIRTLFSRRRAEIRDANLGNRWDDFRSALAAIRTQGYVQTIGESTPGLVGIAAPIFNGEKAVVASVGVAWDAKELNGTNVDPIIRSVKQAGEVISRHMSETDTGPALGPRAIG